MPARTRAQIPSRTYGGRSTAERALERRARLLRAGFELFGSEGYAAATVQRICERARVIPRYFYESFESREALLTAVFTGLVRDAAGAVALALADAPDDPVVRARLALAAFLHSYLDDPRRARIVCVEVGGVSPGLEQLRWTEMRRFAEFIDDECRRLAARGVIPSRDFRMSGVALAGATNQLIIDWLSSKDRPTLEVLHREIVLLFLSMLEGLAPALKRLSPVEWR